jgi:ABC-type multidrug transport system fused ATPase/permease subunit
MSSYKININENSHINSLIRLWNHLDQKRKIQFGLFGILMIISSFAEILSLGALLPFLSLLTSPEKLFNNIHFKPIFNLLEIKNQHKLLFPLTTFFILSIIISGLIRLLVLWVQTRLSTSIAAELGMEVYKKTLYQPYIVHTSRNTSDIITGINKANGIAGHTIMPILIISSSLFIIITILTTLIFIDPLIAISSFIGFGVIYFVIMKYSNKSLLREGDIINTNSAKVIKSIQEGLGGIRDVIIDSNQKKYCDLYKNANYPLLKAHSKVQYISNSPRFVIEALGMILISMLAYILAMRNDGLIGAVPVLGVLVMGIQRLLPIFQQCFSSWATLKGSQASLNKILMYLDQKISQIYIENISTNKLRFNESIIAENISFNYNKESQKIFEDISFKIKKGTKIGIIGETGSGKSTLLDIIMGLISPTSGRILIDNIELNNSNLIQWQKHIAHVPQSIFLADTTIEENISFSSSQSEINMPKVKNAAKKAKIADTIDSWDTGYKTNVGERGVKLSGGQRQRLGIARAMYKEADLIVFDEATSALDSATEQEVMSQIDSFNDKLTVIIIAHRISTLKNCTTILELKDGKLIEHGNYEQLIKNKNNNYVN